MNNNIKICFALTSIIALLVGFGGGYFTAKNNIKRNSQSNFQQFGGGQGGERMMGRANGQGGGQVTRNNSFRPVAGEILSTDDKSITVKMIDGSSKIVLFNDKTEINKASTVQKTELKVGEKVSVFGQTNSDGSVSAQNIQLNPIQRNIEMKQGNIQPDSTR